MFLRAWPVLAGTVLAAALVLPAFAESSTPTLIGKVGLHDGFTISLTSSNGKKVKTIPAGTYTLVVHDYSKIHNFALGSQTANKRLLTGSVPGVGTKTYTLHLAAGSYAYACSAHPATMHGTFIVTAH